MHLPETGYVRLHQIIGRPAVTKAEAARNRKAARAAREAGRRPDNKPKRARPAIPPLIPSCTTSWWKGVKSGRFPKPIAKGILGPNITAWRVDDLKTLIGDATPGIQEQVAASAVPESNSNSRKRRRTAAEGAWR